MRDAFEITDEVLILSMIETLTLYSLITTSTAFKFSPEQWMKIIDMGNKIDDQVVSPQISYLL